MVSRSLTLTSTPSNISLSGPPVAICAGWTIQRAGAHNLRHLEVLNRLLREAIELVVGAPHGHHVTGREGAEVELTGVTGDPAVRPAALLLDKEGVPGVPVTTTSSKVTLTPG